MRDVGSRRFVEGIAGREHLLGPIADLETDRAADDVADDMAGVKVRPGSLAGP